jgi:hypothetical protein
MRIEIDKGLAKLLDGIKAKEPSIYGRGHVETVRFLATYYEHHKPLQQLQEDLELNLTHFLENLNANVERSLETVFPKALAQTISNILTLSKDEKQPDGQVATAPVQSRRGR